MQNNKKKARYLKKQEKHLCDIARVKPKPFLIGYNCSVNNS